MQIHNSIRSCSDLVLDADHALDFLSYLVLQARISSSNVSDKNGASLFLPHSHKNVVAHMLQPCLGINSLFHQSGKGSRVKTQRVKTSENQKNAIFRDNFEDIQKYFKSQ